MCVGVYFSERGRGRERWVYMFGACGTCVCSRACVACNCMRKIIVNIINIDLNVIMLLLTT